MNKETNTAILIADLSGYTALTETHGASSAADLIDRYMEIVEKCLFEETTLHERTGDEVMIVSNSVDALLATACMLLQTAAAEHNFLQVHGGLHYGQLLKRNNGYFGTALNIASRIAAKASAGTFLCSKEFTTALSGHPSVPLRPKGKAGFKNLSEEIELFELAIENQTPFFVDPVCRMLILDKEKALQHPDQEDIFFCSGDCLDIYTKKQMSTKN